MVLRPSSSIIQTTGWRHKAREAGMKKKLKFLKTLYTTGVVALIVGALDPL